MSKVFTHAAAAVCSIVGAASVAAQPPPSAAPLTLATAIELTLARNPELQIYAPRLRAQRAEIETAALAPPLEIRAELEDAFGTGRASGLDSAEATFSLARVIELGGKRTRRVKAAEAGRDLVEIERAAAELDALAEVTRRFIHVAADQAQLDLTATATALAEETVSAARARVAAARAPEVELRRAEISLARAAVDREHAEHELAASRRKLAALWGDSEATFGAIETNLYDAPPLDTFEALVTRLDANPDFARFASEARLRDAELRLAESQRRANLAVSAGVRQLEQTDDQAFVLGFAMPLGSARRAESAVAESAARRAQTDAELAAHRVRAEAQLFELYQELRHAITEAEILRSEVLPAMQAALDATRDAYERGRYGYLEWADAQRELVEVRRALIDASANAHLYRAEIERLTGESLSPTD
jgi:cobalt-zinc-cadmium efflux system outer membrane protein